MSDIYGVKIDGLVTVEVEMSWLPTTFLMHVSVPPFVRTHSATDTLHTYTNTLDTKRQCFTCTQSSKRSVARPVSCNWLSNRVRHRVKYNGGSRLVSRVSVSNLPHTTQQHKSTLLNNWFSGVTTCLYAEWPTSTINTTVQCMRSTDEQAMERETLTSKVTHYNAITHRML